MLIRSLPIGTSRDLPNFVSRMVGVTNAHNCDLAVLHRFEIGHAKHIQCGEVRTENPGTVVQPFVWNHEDKDAALHQPTVQR